MISPKALCEGTQLGTSASTLYTTGANLKTTIKKLTMTNTTNGAVTATVYLVPGGGTAGDANTIRKTRSIGAYECWEVYEAENHVLEAGSFLQALASAGTSITARASGTEQTV